MKILNYLLITALIFMGSIEISEAKKGGSKGTSFSSKSKSSSVSRRTPSKPKTNNSFSSKSKSTAKKLTPAQKAKQDKYKQSVKDGKAFNSREKALSDFKSKNDLSANSKKYPTKFETKPSKRPDYIPESYKDSQGRERQVIYRDGGYGSIDPITGTFMAYSVASDMAMMSMMMNNSGYHVGGPPQIISTSSATKNVFIMFLIVCGGVILVVFLIFKFS